MFCRASPGLQGETVPYIICVERDAEGNVLPEQKSLAERANHPDELTADSGLAVDVDYYLTQQVSSPAGTQSVRWYQTHSDVGFTRQIKGHLNMQQPVRADRPIAQACTCRLFPGPARLPRMGTCWCRACAPPLSGGAVNSSACSAASDSIPGIQLFPGHSPLQVHPVASH